MSVLQAEHIRVRLGGAEIVRDVSLTLSSGTWLMLAGPNGAGKSTLLSALMQGLRYEGSVRMDGEDLARMKPAQRAKRVGMLCQRHAPGYAFSVEEVVSLGRYAYTRGGLTREDRERVDEALLRTGMADRRRQSVLTLSGGELQRTFLAQVFAQDPAVLLLDEPVNHLDLAYQKQLCSLICEWVGQPGKAVLSVMHDLSLAKKYGTEAVLLSEGRILAAGDPAKAFSPEQLAAAYHMDVSGWMKGLLSVWNQ